MTNEVITSVFKMSILSFETNSISIYASSCQIVKKKISFYVLRNVPNVVHKILLFNQVLQVMQ